MVINRIKENKRLFLPEDFKVTTWTELEPYYTKLVDMLISSSQDLMSWMKYRSELESIVSEDMAWRYIHMTCDTSNKDFVNQYTFFVSEIEPHIAPMNDKLNQKFLQSPYKKELKGSEYAILIRSIQKEVDIFREENISLMTNIQVESQKYGSITGAMMVDIDGKELTLPQAAELLLHPDREVRENVYKKINDRRLKDKDELDTLFDKLISLRNQVSFNAGFKNFRDYMFVALGRFDYTPDDCFKFHDSIKYHVLPLVNDIVQERKNEMKLDILRPWDSKVDVSGMPALRPFEKTSELIDKTIQAFYQIDTYFGDCIATMKEMKHLDLDSRKGKAPGGYNYPLAEVGVPFIFMNATSTLRDVVTLFHEGGHAIHSFLTKDLLLNDFKHTPSEVAELASMSMELISMDYWSIFFDNEKDLNRAKIEHLEDIIETLPWVATIDKFQHWIYENPVHAQQDRVHEWNKIFNQFTDQVTDWEELEKYKNYIWQKQLHVYEVPFYYIEYGMAQLGAIAIWKNFKENKSRAIAQYVDALRLGYTKSIASIYETAGIRFDFSKEYIAELMSFVKQELVSYKKIYG